jgi:hypothetical protein
VSAFLLSLRDAGQVARFHVVRAIRTRTVVFLCAVYMLMAGGVAWIFRGIIHELEKNAADLMRVPLTDTPGAMMETLRNREELRSIMGGLLPDDSLVDWALTLPVLTIAHFWMALGALTFLAAVIGAEVVSPGIRDRSLRYELVRTGRLELVLGRWAGQAVLVALATLLSIVGPLVVGTFFMVQQPFGQSLQVLLSMTPRLVAWSLPFLGLGVACSQLTGNTNFARILALASATGTWILMGVFSTDWMRETAPVVADVLEPLLPQTYMVALWGPGFGWLTPSGILLGLGLAFTLLGFPLFARRNL